MYKSKRICLPPFEVEKVVSTLSQVTGWGLQELLVPDTWKVTEGEGQLVYVIDTGTPQHVDLEDSIDLGNCRNFTREKTIYDGNGHSTHCVGVITANNNEFGMVGVAPKSTVVCAKSLASDGSGAIKYFQRALEYALLLKPNVISMSLGFSDYNGTIHDIIKELYRMNIPLIAAAGNSGLRSGDSIQYPAKYPECISVAAFDETGNIADFSSKGERVDVTAPGVEVYSTWLNNEYAMLSGTSMACPFVSGVTALLLAKHKKQEQLTGKNDCRTVEEIRQHLTKYATDKGLIGKDREFGYGVINPSKLLLEE